MAVGWDVFCQRQKGYLPHVSVGRTDDLLSQMLFGMVGER